MNKYIFTAVLAVLLLGTTTAAFSAGNREKPQAPSAPGKTESVTESPAPAAENRRPTDNILSSIGFQLPARTIEAPDFTLETLDGESRSLKDYRGKIVLLNFWATWCPPCRAEMPSMQTMYDSLPREDFEIVAVDVQEDRDTVQSFISQNGYTFPVLLDESGQIGATYGVRGIPTTFLLDREGMLLGMTVGGREWDEATISAIKELIRDDS